MIPRAFRVLLPCPPAAVEQQTAAGVPTSFAPAANSEHARLTEGTAELWFALVARLGS